MIRRIFSSQSKTITGAAIILGAASLVSRLIAILRDRFFAHTFGAGDVLDAYYAAFRIPDTVYNLLVIGALSAGFIPVFAEVWEQNKEKAWHLANNLMTILGVALVSLSGILFLFAPWIMPLLVPGFGPEKIELTVSLARVMVLSPIILGLSSIVSGMLQTWRHFLVYALTPIVYNLGIIFGILALVPLFGAIGLAFGVVLGAFFHLMIQLPTLVQKGFRFTPTTNFQDPATRKIGKLMIPRTLGLAAHQVNWIAMTMFASTLGAGSLAIFSLTENLQYAPVSIFGVSFALAAFPILSTFVAKGQTDQLVTHVSQTIRKILFFVVPVTIVLLLLRAQIIRVLLGSGQFDWQATILAADALAFFALSLFAQALIPLFARAFYALHNTWIPFIIGGFAVLVNIMLGLHLKDIYGIPGLALAFSVSMIVHLCLLWVMLHLRVGSLRELSILQTLYKLSIAALCMALVIQFLKAPIANMVDMTRFWGIFVQGLVAGSAGLLVYGLITKLLKVEEMIDFASSFKKRWLKLVGNEVGTPEGH